MAAKLMSNSLKNTLVKKAQENASVTLGTKKEQRTLRQGIPCEHSVKHLDGKPPVVGVSIGSTINMENYQSLRADVWLTDEVQSGETISQAYERVAQIVSDTLQEIVYLYKDS